MSAHLWPSGQGSGRGSVEAGPDFRFRRILIWLQLPIRKRMADFRIPDFRWRFLVLQKWFEIRGILNRKMPVGSSGFRVRRSRATSPPGSDWRRTGSEARAGRRPSRGRGPSAARGTPAAELGRSTFRPHPCKLLGPSWTRSRPFLPGPEFRVGQLDQSSGEEAPLREARSGESRPRRGVERPPSRQRPARSSGSR